MHVKHGFRTYAPQGFDGGIRMSEAMRRRGVAGAAPPGVAKMHILRRRVCVSGARRSRQA